MHSVSRRRTGSASQRGFTYLGLLFAVAILGITLATIGVVWSTQIRREKEAQLLWVGDQYRAAIMNYRMAGGTLPLALADLIEDKRTPVPRRYLRRLYPDPMTGAADWTLIYAPDGVSIAGVASQSQAQPIKVANFTGDDTGFEGMTCYCDWQFVVTVHRKRVRRPAAAPTAD